MNLLKRIWNHRIARPLLGAGVGGGLGAVYYAFIGCNMGGG